MPSAVINYGLLLHVLLSITLYDSLSMQLNGPAAWHTATL